MSYLIKFISILGIMLICPLIQALQSEIEIDGKLMLDGDIYDGVFNQLDPNSTDSDISIRRARIKFKYQIATELKSSLQLSYDDDEVNIRTATLAYTGWDFADLTIGKLKEPFSLERVTSSSDITMIERSMASSVFSPGYNYGIALNSEKKKNTWSFGIFDAREDGDRENAYALTGRVTKAFFDKSQNYVNHLGLSVSLRESSESTYKINERAEVNLSDKIVESPRITADSLSLYSLEAASSRGPFTIKSEYFNQKVKAVETSDEQDATYSGYYIQASYILTGETAKYKKGVFERVSPNRKNGAWELTGRVSNLDALENDSGTEADNTTLGLNYYYSDDLRVMLNVTHSKLKGRNTSIKESGNALSVRFQWDF